MAAQLPLMINFLDTANSLIEMDRRKSRAQEKARQQRKILMQKQKAELAYKQANKFAKGVSGRSFEQSLENIKRRYQSHVNNVAGAEGNTMGKINLLLKAIKRTRGISDATKRQNALRGKNHG